MTRTLPRAFGAFLGFIGLSVVAGLLVGMIFVPTFAVAGEGLVTGANTFNALPSYLQITQPAQASSLYAKKGNANVKIASFYVQDRTDVASDQISDLMKKATIATEDPRYYHEGAIDLQGTIRGVLSTTLGHDVQGGSSITQQYVKNVLVQRCEQAYDQNTDKGKAQATACYKAVTATTPARKLREMRYAIGVEKKYSKDEILRGYLNIVGFGGQVYGVQAASEYYFGVSASALSVTQAATLAAILNNPANLRIDQPKNAANGSANGYKLTLDRRNYVLSRMHVHHDISTADYEAAIKTPVAPKITPSNSGCDGAVAYDAGYFCEYVRYSVLQDKAFGDTAAARLTKLTQGGLKIYTTLNLDLQNMAQTNLSAYMPKTVPGLSLGAAHVAVEPGTGHIVTMVQNTGFSQTTGQAGYTSVNYNADHDHGNSQGFQTGSSFKPFTLAAWLEAGHTLSQGITTTQHDFPTTEFTNSCDNINGPDWMVSNADPAPATMSVLNATAESVNTAFAQMGKQLDLCGILNVAKGMGIHSADPSNPDLVLKDVPSMILGTNYIAPLSMATAYAGIANNGVVCTPVSIEAIKDAEGKSIKATPTTCTQGMPADIAHGLAYALQTVLKPGGTGASANPGDGVPIIAKTGTTDAAVQNWLVTSTSKIAQATWVGNVEGTAGFYDTYVNGVYGYDLKFKMDQPILQAYNRAYPGAAAFAAPPASEIGYVKPVTPSRPTTGGSNPGTGSTNKTAAPPTQGTGTDHK